MLCRAAVEERKVGLGTKFMVQSSWYKVQDRGLKTMHHSESSVWSYSISYEVQNKTCILFLENSGILKFLRGSLLLLNDLFSMVRERVNSAKISKKKMYQGIIYLIAPNFHFIFNSS